MNTIEQLKKNKIIAVLRGYSTEDTLSITDQLVDGGIRTIEVTMDSPEAEESLRRLSERSDDLLAGAGTVRTVRDVKRAADAGAEFGLSPVFDPEVVKACRDQGLAAVPGGMTPGEIMEAHQAGADAVKIFPASVVGPSFLSSVRGPLPDIPMIPTGGVDDQDAPSFFDAGAAAVGVGSYLTNGFRNADSDSPSVRERAASLMSVVG